MTAVTEAALGRSLSGEEAARALTARYPSLRLLLVTEGERGAFAYEPRTDKLTRVAAVPVTVASTVGAGDSFGAAFLYAYLAGKPLAECLAVAARVSAFVVSHTEAVPEYRIEDLF
jgi:sugar/nucleoside kinase (ribokinase family)